jgi:hypothetical protein
MPSGPGGNILSPNTIQMLLNANFLPPAPSGASAGSANNQQQQMDDSVAQKKAAQVSLLFCSTFYRWIFLVPNYSVPEQCPFSGSALIYISR